MNIQAGSGGFYTEIKFQYGKLIEVKGWRDVAELCELQWMNHHNMMMMMMKVISTFNIFHQYTYCAYSHQIMQL